MKKFVLKNLIESEVLKAILDFSDAINLGAFHMALAYEYETEQFVLVPRWEVEDDDDYEVLISHVGIYISPNEKEIHEQFFSSFACTAYRNGINWRHMETDVKRLLPVK